MSEMTAADAPPRPLACLCRYYACQAQQEAGQWWLVAGAARVPYRDGKHKTPEERLASPDVLDVFSPRYRPGAVGNGPVAGAVAEPIVGPGNDPGRARIEPLFAATYGHTRAEVDVVRVPFAGSLLLVNRKVAPAFARVAARLAEGVASDPAARPFLQKLGGTFVWRKIAGTDRQSAHSYGVSLDLNAELTDYWRWQRPAPLRFRHPVPQSVVDAFEAEGFIWGGRWSHYDTMHFEYRPELLDPSCYPDDTPR